MPAPRFPVVVFPALIDAAVVMARHIYVHKLDAAALPAGGKEAQDQGGIVVAPCARGLRYMAWSTLGEAGRTTDCRTMRSMAGCLR